MSPYYRYWGKAGTAGEGPASVHLLPYHCLDVAAAGQALLEINPRLAEYLARLTGLDVAGLRRWAPFFLALHDIGKFADAFQNLRPDLRTRLLGRAGSR
ncbi:MAG TPA: CRISPR-associated endonuclease Cas3'', partial [Gammaproteobacteria bacterium]|nr:CRISPR-associated endonuclease Cas3'' [Gammaproteobacteria bacterium]